MKILILTSYSSVYGGNFIPSILSFADYALSNGDEVGFALNIKVAKRDWVEEIKRSFPVYFVENSGLLKDSLGLNTYIKENKYDCLYSHFSYFNMACIISLINHSVSVVCHKHTDIGSDLTFKRKLRIFAKKTFIYRNMSLIFVSERLRHFEGMDNNESSYWIPNAIVTDRFNLENKNAIRSEFREKNQIDSNSVAILMFGWHLQVKGVDIAVKAFQKILCNHPNTYLMIVSSTKLGPDGLKQQLTPYVSERTIERIKFLNPVADVERYHFASDIFLSSSRSEGFPYSILEALYTGERVVSSILEGTKWAMKYPATLGFESENIDDCADKLNKAIDNISNDIVTQISSSEVEKDYSIQNWCTSVYNVLKLTRDKKNMRKI